ncbi:hypothetical protein [Hymenobacter saemangeumensis]|uniref:hypothetical protein n=1 Tax=Hymenobacter saemangeumensis TaxID=1084522 RepID=UPI0031EFE5D4
MSKRISEGLFEPIRLASSEIAWCVAVALIVKSKPNAGWCVLEDKEIFDRASCLDRRGWAEAMPLLSKFRFFSYKSGGFDWDCYEIIPFFLTTRCHTPNLRVEVKFNPKARLFLQVLKAEIVALDLERKLSPASLMEQMKQRHPLLGLDLNILPGFPRILEQRFNLYTPAERKAEDEVALAYQPEPILISGATLSLKPVRKPVRAKD